MYSGSNPTALASQKLMLEALTDLMEEKPFKSITVSELCDRSGVSRQTFYSLFGKKENILLFQLDLVNDTKPEDPDNTDLTLDQVCANFARYVSSNYKILEALVENDLAAILQELIYNAMSSCASSFVDVDEVERDYAARFMSAGLCALTTRYVATHASPKRRDLERLARKIMSGSVYRY